MHPGVVVFATGGPPQLSGLELKVPAGHVKGHLLTTDPSSLRLPGTVAPLATQLEDGRLLVGGTLDVGDDSSIVRPEVISSLWSDLRAELPIVSGLRISHQWCCFRPTHPDGLPVIDRVPGLINAWVTSGHFRTGILMAPATGRALADWIGTGRRPSQVAGLELGRFEASEHIERQANR
jgi:glycine/D-amino acid oxidase-like deaminating enzyme